MGVAAAASGTTTAPPDWPTAKSPARWRAPCAIRFIWNTIGPAAFRKSSRKSSSGAPARGWMAYADRVHAAGPDVNVAWAMALSAKAANADAPAGEPHQPPAVRGTV